MNPEVVGFDPIDSCPCLILLAEPGNGKTFAIRYERRRLETIYLGSQNILQWVDLKDHGDVDRLYRDICASQWWNPWMATNNHLTVFHLIPHRS